MDSREVKGRMIAEKPDQVQRMDERFYKVASQNGHGMYDVVKTKTGWICSCLDHVYRKVRCKHIWAVQFSLKIREQVQARVIEPITAVQVCLYCKSEKIVKDGLRRNKYGSIQLFNCQSCGRYFSFNIGFERMKHNPQAIGQIPRENYSAG